MLCSALLWPIQAEAVVVFEEMFDTLTQANRPIYSNPHPRLFIDKGVLILKYSSNQSNEATGIGFTFPHMDKDPQERRIEINIIGGGAETSNSLFISYAVGPGKGLSLPVLPGGTEPNNLTGYIIRCIKHGDGTNEVKFYRNDEGWEKELKNDWTLTFNPITTLRKTTILHRQNGEHVIALTFDTGVPTTRTYSFRDDSYPPNSMRQGLQLIAKGHASVGTLYQIITDTWTVNDMYTAGGGKNPSEGRPHRVTDTTAEGFMMLGTGEIAAGNYANANRYLMEALERYKALYGPGGIRVAQTLTYLAKIHIQKDPDTAEALYQQALAIREKKSGPHHPDVAGVLAELGDFYRIRGHYEKSAPLLKRALAIRERPGGSDDGQMASLLEALASLYEAQGQYALELTVLERLLPIQEKSSGASPLALSKTLQQMVFAYQNIGGQTQKMVPLLERAVEIKQKALGEDHPDVAKVVSSLAVLYQNQGKFTEAEDLYRRSIRIREKALGPVHPFVAADRSDLGVLYMTQGRYPEAETEFKRALAIFEKSLGSDHSNVAEVSEKMSKLFARTGRLSESEYHADRARNIRGNSPK